MKMKEFQGHEPMTKVSIIFMVKVDYHCTDIVSNSREEKREHSEKIKKLSNPVNISTEDLLSIPTRNFSFK